MNHLSVVFLCWIHTDRTDPGLQVSEPGFTWPGSPGRGSPYLGSPGHGSPGRVHQQQVTVRTRHTLHGGCSPCAPEQHLSFTGEKEFNILCWKWIFMLIGCRQTERCYSASMLQICCCSWNASSVSGRWSYSIIQHVIQPENWSWLTRLRCWGTDTVSCSGNERVPLLDAPLRTGTGICYLTSICRSREGTTSWHILQICHEQATEFFPENCIKLLI